ncbi:hypothetical protein WJX74_005324 [Apatococcus lobatus]|uniref:Uncharacterized protein n=1 Tax=Apatococcus lobatus TaxID=904363 RepID=A0AAW1QTG3_9CHLO
MSWTSQKKGRGRVAEMRPLPQAAEQRASDAEADLLRAEEELASVGAELRGLQEQMSSQEAAQGSRQEAEANSVSAAEERSTALAAQLASARAEADQGQARCQTLETDIKGLQQALRAEQSKSKGSPSKPDASDTLATLRASQTAVQGLEVQVARLRISRDKLLAEVDALSAELERLGLENTALMQGTDALRESCSKWEAQATEGLEQNQKLMDLLSESAAWPESAEAVPANDKPGSLQDSSRTGLTAQAAVSAPPSEIGLAQQLLQAHSRTAELELQVRALCCELLRAHESSGAAQRVMLPALSGIEAQLMELARLGSVPT